LRHPGQEDRGNELFDLERWTDLFSVIEGDRMGFVHNIDPVMFTIGGFDVYWYGFAYTFGFTFMVFWMRRQSEALGWSAREVVLAGIIFSAFVLVGARVFDVVVYEWQWYRQHLEQVPQLWRGGMATHGVLIGAVLAALLTAWLTVTPVLALIDSLVVSAAFVLAVSRIGNFIEGGVIGTVTTMPWGVKFPDVAGFRHPVALYDGAKNLLLVPVLMGVLKRWPPGRGVGAAAFLLGYGGLRFIVDQYRDYESALWGIGPGQWFNLAMAAVGLVMLVICLRRPIGRREPREPRLSKGVTLLGVVVLVLLILFPLSIATSWTKDYIAILRGVSAQGARSE
jgi:phosphatidylglycerol:prolipoprotein diacylglycerol transferase